MDILHFFLGSEWGKRRILPPKIRQKDIHWKIINYALSTASNTVTIPLQDVLGENSSARFNIPGTLSPDNWSWRMEEGKLTHSLKNKLAELTKRHRRNGSTIKNLLKKEKESWK